jgi:sulfopyruvate decarboxylase TPP-binding subunit
MLPVFVGLRQFIQMNQNQMKITIAEGEIRICNGAKLAPQVIMLRSMSIVSVGSSLKSLNPFYKIYKFLMSKLI